MRNSVVFRRLLRDVGAVFVLWVASSSVPAAALAREAAPTAAGALVQPSAGPELREELTESHCRYLMEAAGSESALLWSPQVFSRFGTLRASSDDPADEQNVVGDSTLLSLQAGLEFSPIRMRQGALVEARARAECRRYAAELALEALEEQLSTDQSAALAARGAALRSKLPEAEALLEESRLDLSQSRINLQRYTAIRARVAELRRSLEDAEIELAAATVRANTASVQRAAQPLHELVQAEEAAQSVEGSLRRLAAFDINVRGGYERIFGPGQSLPLFGSITVSFVPGSFWQSSSESRGASARRRWVEARVRQVRERLTAAATGLAQQLATSRRQQARLEDETTELQSRYAELERVKSSAARDFQLELWFELAQLEADLAYARLRTEALEQQRAQLLRVLGP